MIKGILKWTSNIIIILLAISVAISLYSIIQSNRNPGQIPSILGYRPMTILTGSMRPVLEPGDMIVARNVNPETIKKGDVLTYIVSKDTLITHRVIEIVKRDENILFRTKGDANNVEDDILISSDKILGTMVFRIPYFGYIASFARTPMGLVLFIIIPVILLMFGEIKSIKAQRKRQEVKN